MPDPNGRGLVWTAPAQICPDGAIARPTQFFLKFCPDGSIGPFFRPNLSGLANLARKAVTEYTILAIAR
jgi:hypothetical protein